jgi:hypothetical protein
VDSNIDTSTKRFAFKYGRILIWEIIRKKFVNEIATPCQELLVSLRVELQWNPSEIKIFSYLNFNAAVSAPPAAEGILVPFGNARLSAGRSLPKHSLSGLLKTYAPG